MRNIVLGGLIAIAVFSLGCGTGFSNKTLEPLESNVIVDGKEYKVFYKVEREQGDIDWEGKRLGVVQYDIRDEATRNSKFCVRVIYDMRYDVSFFRLSAYPMYFSKVDSRSFLQKIILENNADRGQEIFRDIFDQLEQSRNK